MNPIKHVAIIMDGNGRWGLKHKKSRNAGHRAGLNTVEKIIKETLKHKIQYLTLYTFSTENWRRPKKEILFLFTLLENFLLKKIGDLIESYKFREAVNTLIDLARLGNKYLADEEPWKLIKTENSERVKTIMNIALQLSGVLSIVSEPFLPNTALKLRNMLNLQSSDWNSISKENPIILSKINKGELLFRKIEDDEIDLQLQKLNESK